MELDGKSAIVTGAARSIGAACAEALARKGARVVLSDVDRHAGEAEPLYAQAIAIREKILRMEYTELLMPRASSRPSAT